MLTSVFPTEAQAGSPVRLTPRLVTADPHSNDFTSIGVSIWKEVELAEMFDGAVSFKVLLEELMQPCTTKVEDSVVRSNVAFDRLKLPNDENDQRYYQI